MEEGLELAIVRIARPCDHRYSNRDSPYPPRGACWDGLELVAMVATMLRMCRQNTQLVVMFL